MAESFQIEYWMSLPRVWRGWVRVLTPDGRLYCDCRERELEGVLEAWSEEPLRFFRRLEWREFLRQHVRESALSEFPCSPTVN